MDEIESLNKAKNELSKPVDLSELKSKVEEYSTKFYSLDRPTKKALLAEIFECIIVSGNTFELHMKKAPARGALNALWWVIERQTTT